MGTDKDWERWGRDDPYFGVLSREDFRSGAMSDTSRAEFFRSGEEHIDALHTQIRSHFDADFRPNRALDFGCGVGRLLVPLARLSNHATGVDVSPSMLAEARRNCEAFAVDNIDLVASTDRVDLAHGEFDLVHSHIVFAHIEPGRGHVIFESLAAKVAPSGFIAVQVLYSCNAPWTIRILSKLRYRFPPINGLRNLLRGRPLSEPPMQLHIYNLPTLLRTLNRLGFGDALLSTDHFDNGTFDSVVILARRRALN